MIELQKYKKNEKNKEKLWILAFWLGACKPNPFRRFLERGFSGKKFQWPEGFELRLRFLFGNPPHPARGSVSGCCRGRHIQRARVLCHSGCPPHSASSSAVLQRLSAASCEIKGCVAAVVCCSLRVCVLRRIAGPLPLANNRRLFPDRRTRLLPGVGPTALPGRFPATGSLKRGHPSLVAMKKRS